MMKVPKDFNFYNKYVNKKKINSRLINNKNPNNFQINSKITKIIIKLMVKILY